MIDSGIDAPALRLYNEQMEVHINNQLSEQLCSCAAQMGQEPDSLVHEALVNYLEGLKLVRLRAAIAAGDTAVGESLVYNEAFMAQIARDARARVASGHVSTNSDATGF